MGRIEAEWLKIWKTENKHGISDDAIAAYRVMFFSGALAFSKCITEISELGQEAGYMEFVKMKQELAEFAHFMLKEIKS